MSKMQSLLQILSKQKGTHILLKAGQAPQFYRLSEPLKLFFPDFNHDTLWQMIQEITPQEKLDALLAKDMLQFEYFSISSTFQVSIKNK